MNKFDIFFKDKDYLYFKNNLFNYLNRKKSILSEVRHIKFRKALDVGSGVSPILSIGRKITFVDISSSAVEFLKSKGARAFQGDIMGLKQNGFDLIICSEVLEHVKDYKKCIRNLYSSLLYKGTLILTIPVHKYYWGFDDIFVGHIRRFNPKELIQDLKNAGFKISKIRPIGNPLERLMTMITVHMFKSMKKISKKKKNDNDNNRVLLTRLYKAANILLSNVLYLVSFLTPVSLSSIILVKCRK